MSVLCKICGIRPAQIHFTEIVDNKVVSLDLCMECAQERGIDIQKGGSYGLGDLVAGLIDKTVESESERIGKVHCSFCNYNYSDFKRIGRLGCPECYRAFEAQLLQLLRHIHGRTHHTGKTPAKLGPQAAMRKELMRLKEDLNQAVESEEYEKAATIRDRIKEIESKTKGS